jgi:hypothetical protein
VAFSPVLPPRIPQQLIESSHSITGHPLLPSLFTVDDTRGAMMQLECGRLDWLCNVVLASVGTNRTDGPQSKKFSKWPRQLNRPRLGDKRVVDQDRTNNQWG